MGGWMRWALGIEAAKPWNVPVVRQRSFSCFVWGGGWVGGWVRGVEDGWHELL